MFPRILAVSDIHANWEWFAWVIRHAHRFDLICIGGDLCEIFTERATLKEQHRSILDRLSRLAATGPDPRGWSCITNRPSERRSALGRTAIGC